MQKTVQHIFKFAEQLNFVENDIICPVILNPGFYVRQHVIRIAQLLVASVVQSNFYDMVAVNALSGQVIVKKIEKQI